MCLSITQLPSFFLPLLTRFVISFSLHESNLPKCRLQKVHSTRMGKNFFVRSIPTPMKLRLDSFFLLSLYIYLSLSLSLSGRTFLPSPLIWYIQFFQNIFFQRDKSKKALFSFLSTEKKLRKRERTDSRKEEEEEEEQVYCNNNRIQSVEYWRNSPSFFSYSQGLCSRERKRKREREKKKWFFHFNSFLLAQNSSQKMSLPIESNQEIKSYNSWIPFERRRDKDHVKQMQELIHCFLFFSLLSPLFFSFFFPLTFFLSQWEVLIQNNK